MRDRLTLTFWFVLFVCLPNQIKLFLNNIFFFGCIAWHAELAFNVSIAYKIEWFFKLLLKFMWKHGNLHVTKISYHPTMSFPPYFINQCESKLLLSLSVNMLVSRLLIIFITLPIIRFKKFIKNGLFMSSEYLFLNTFRWHDSSS